MKAYEAIYFTLGYVITAGLGIYLFRTWKRYREEKDMSIRWTQRRWMQECERGWTQK